MMTHYALLLKKQLIDSLPSRSKGKRNLSGAILFLALAAVIIAVFVFIFARFTRTYTAIRIHRIPDIPARQFEIMTFAYFALLIVCLLSGVSKLSYTLFENSDVGVLITMPFSSADLFLAKLTEVYIKQLALSFAFVLPVNLTFFIVTSTVSVYNVLMTIVVALILPIIPLMIASILVLPYFFLKRAITSRYLLSFLTTTLVTAAFCFGYAYLFKFAQNLLNAGRLASLFDENVMSFILHFTKNCYPANLIANIMLGRELLKSFGILAAMLAVAILVSFLVIRAIFIRVTQSGFNASVPHVLRRPRYFKSPRMLSLLNKELVSVLRTPSYSFMFLTTAIIMPVMAYHSAKLASSLLASLLGDVNIQFELCTFLVILYGTLSNTFCSTGISRDGYMNMMQKTLPYSPAELLSAKMLFSGIVSELSIVAACLTLFLTGLEKPVDVVVTFFSATLLMIAQLAFATRLDLNHPNFSKVDDGEIKEANRTVSTIIVLGLAVCMLIGGLMFLNPLVAFSRGDEAKTWQAYLYALLIPLALLTLAGVYFFRRLKVVFANLDAEG